SPAPSTQPATAPPSAPADSSSSPQPIAVADLSAFRKHLDLTQASGKPGLTLSRLRGGQLSVAGVVGALRISEVSDCTVLVAAVSGSVFITQCHNCVFSIAARQVRACALSRVLSLTRRTGAHPHDYRLR